MRIVTMGPAHRLGAGILPVPASDARAYQSRGTINGYPGTLPIPAPMPAATPQDYPFQALHKSSQAPEYWRPALYWQRGQDGTRPDVSVESDNQLPIPAKPPAGRPAIMLRHPTFLGQNQVGAINNVPFFAWRGSK